MFLWWFWRIALGTIILEVIALPASLLPPPRFSPLSARWAGVSPTRGEIGASPIRHPPSQSAHGLPFSPANAMKHSRPHIRATVPLEA